ncbi:MAG: NADH-quinone oxidoreductase subunit M [Chitinophagales bacterium]|nr:NADH-quinone oxidoreductase subunit M [Bacteroidota bacterium]
MLVLSILIIPLVFVLLIALMSSSQSKRIALLGTLTTLGVSMYAFSQFLTDANSINLIYKTTWIERLGANFHIQLDGINLILVLLTTLLSTFIVYSAYEREIKSPKTYFSLMLMMQSALLGVFLAKDALLFYIFWELTLIPIYLICLVFGGEGRQRITFKFFVFTMFGSLFMLLAILFLWLHNPAHTFAIADFYKAGAALPASQQVYVFIAFYLAFAIKIPIFPLHTWQPDTYVNAPTQGTMLLSGIMLKMGTYALIVWLIPTVPLGWKLASKYVIIISIISVVYGSLMALIQQNFKRLLAYSSLGHVGLIAAGIFSFNLQGVQGALYQMLSHGINVVALFFICDIIQQRMKTDNMQALGGIRNVSKLFGAFFIVATFASVALPITNSFVGEFLLLHGIFQYNSILAAVGCTTVILSAMYMLRAYQLMMHGETNELTASFGKITMHEKIMLGALAILILFFGVYPNLLLHISEEPLKQLIEQVRHATLAVTYSKF